MATDQLIEIESKTNADTSSPLPSHLDAIEAEAIHILREVAAEFDNPAILYSIGKDSSVILHLAQGILPRQAADASYAHRLDLGIP